MGPAVSSRDIFLPGVTAPIMLRLDRIMTLTHGATALQTVEGHRQRQSSRSSASGAAERFRPDIQGLRAVAVIGVLAYHAGIPWLRGGFSGVDVFFVISGFLITQGLLRTFVLDSPSRAKTLAAFYGRRVARLLPAATLVLLVGWALTVLLEDGSSSSRSQVLAHSAGDLRAAATWTANVHSAQDFLRPGAFDGAGLSVSTHFWSLSAEEQFYLFWPVLVIGLTALAAYIAHRRSRHQDLAIGFVLVGSLAIAASSFAAAMIWTGRNEGYSYFSPVTRVWELAVGTALASAVLLWQRRRPASLERVSRGVPSALLVAAGLGLILVGYATLDHAHGFPGPYALVPVMGAALVLLAGSGSVGGAGDALMSGRAFQHVGRISYSYYLWHWPAVVVGIWVLGPLDGWRGTLVVLAAWPIAWASTVWVEDPLRRSRVRRLRFAIPFAALSVASVFIVTAPYVTR